MTDLKLSIKTLGPGIWHVIHTLAYHATTEELKNNFITTMTLLCDHFGCNQCKTHLTQFMTNYPIKNYFEIENGLFKWTWELHNAVNKTLNKPQIKLEVAIQTYKNNTCQNCAASQTTSPAPFLVPIKQPMVNPYYVNFISR
jgi:hypothetical protein